MWVAVTHIINPTHFYVRYVMERKAEVLLAKKINSTCSGERSKFTKGDHIKTGKSVENLVSYAYTIPGHDDVYSCMQKCIGEKYRGLCCEREWSRYY